MRCRTDPNTGTVVLQSSQKQRVQGFEASVTGEVLPHFNLTASYTYLNPVITQDATTPFNNGRQITFVPKNSVSVWGDYNARDLLEGLSLGGGVVYQSNLFNNLYRPDRAAAGRDGARGLSAGPHRAHSRDGRTGCGGGL